MLNYMNITVEKSTTNLEYPNVFLTSFIRFERQQYLFPSEFICILLMSVTLFINVIEINFLVHIC